MPTAQDQALAVITQKFASGEIDDQTYQSLLAAVTQMAPAVQAPVKESKAKPSALNDKTRRVYIHAAVSENFEFGHITLSKGNRRFGIWAEDVDNVIDEIMSAYAALPEAVREAAEEAKS